jgi:hypothetical protein
MEGNNVMLTMSAKISLRSNFSFHHLQAAAQAARNAYEVEQTNDLEVFGPWFDQMIMWVPVSVVMAGAALEASGNELAQDILEQAVKPPLTVSRGTKELLLIEELIDDQSGNAVGRYRTLALLFDMVPDNGNIVWQDAVYLVKFRNSFMHFKPAWDDESDVHNGKLVRYLRTKFKVSPHYQTNFQFPYGFMTYDCAKWCVKTVVSFSKYFSGLLGVQDRLAIWHPKLTLP